MKYKPLTLTLAAAACMLLLSGTAGNAVPAFSQPRGNTPPAGCPAFNTQNYDGALKALAENLPPDADPAIREQMRVIARALEQNRQSTEIMLGAARIAGARPEQLADLERLSATFRRVFMVSAAPYKVMRGLVAQSQPQTQQRPPAHMGMQKGAPAGPQSCQQSGPQAAPGQAAPQPAQAAPEMSAEGFIIVAPDGTRWTLIPAQPGQANQPGQPGRNLQAPSAPKAAPAQPRQQGPAAQVPPAPSTSPEAPFNAGRQPGQQTGQQPGQNGVIIEEEVVEEMPLWPTKDDLGRLGVLKYLEKRQAMTDKAN